MTQPPTRVSPHPDPLMRTRAYVLSVESRDLAVRVVRELMHHEVLQNTLNQLLDAATSIGANISEGYGRSTGTERARFFEYALGSVREAAHWYGALAPFVDRAIIDEEARRDDEIIRLLITMVRRQRALGSKRLGEHQPQYNPRE